MEHGPLTIYVLIWEWSLQMTGFCRLVLNLDPYIPTGLRENGKEKLF